AVSGSPLLGQYLDQSQLRQVRASAAEHPIPVSAITQADQFLRFYVADVRMPLLASRLGPVVNDAGSRLPFVGHPRPYLQARENLAACSPAGPAGIPLTRPPAGITR